jgi:hypothetical protein
MATAKSSSQFPVLSSQFSVFDAVCLAEKRELGTGNSLKRLAQGKIADYYHGLYAIISPGHGSQRRFSVSPFLNMALLY